MNPNPFCIALAIPHFVVHEPWVRCRKREGYFFTCPEEDQVLFFQRGHFFHDGPEPAFEGHQAVGAFSTLVIERGVADQGLYVDVTHLKVLRKEHFVFSKAIPAFNVIE